MIMLHAFVECVATFVTLWHLFIARFVWFQFAVLFCFKTLWLYYYNHSVLRIVMCKFLNYCGITTITEDYCGVQVP
jgi:hypothetical protein